MKKQLAVKLLNLKRYYSAVQSIQTDRLAGLVKEQCADDEKRTLARMVAPMDRLAESINALVNYLAKEADRG